MKRLLFSILYGILLYKTTLFAEGLAMDHWLGSFSFEQKEPLSFSVALLPSEGFTVQGMLFEHAGDIIDKQIRSACEKYFSSVWEKNRCIALSHYLLFRESNYGATHSCGDGGRACGVMQFWQETYLRARKEMMKKGLVSSIGSRENLHDAIETAVYMFSQGREHEWGPAFRGEIKL